MNKYLKIFLQNAVFSGLLIGVVMVLLELKFFKLGGVLYGALPIGFLYIMFYYYIKKIDRSEKLNKLLHFSHFSVIGGLLFLIVMAVYYFILKSTESFVWATIGIFGAIFLTLIILFTNLKIK